MQIVDYVLIGIIAIVAIVGTVSFLYYANRDEGE